MSGVNDAVVSSGSVQSSAGAVNLSLIKISTITQTALGIAVTGLVVLATVVTIVLISTRAGFEPPLAYPDSAPTFKNTVLDIYPLANDVNPRGDNLTLTYITDPEFGSVTIVDGNTVQYKAGLYWAGTLYMNYTCMNDKLSAMSTITIFVVNRPPEPIVQEYTISKNSANNALKIFEYTNTLGQKVVDIDGDAMYVVNTTQPSHGSLSFDANTVYYTPMVNYIDTDSFEYCVSDYNDTACSYVNITVMNDPPVAVKDSYEIPKNQPTKFNVMWNDYDPNNDSIILSEVTPAAYGGVTLSDQNTRVYYIPVMSSEVYADSFSYGITDGILFGYAYVTVSVGNSPPKADDLTITIKKNTNATVIALPASDANLLDVLTVTIPKPSTIGTYKLINTPSVEQVPIDGDYYAHTKNSYTLVYTPLYGLSGVYKEVIQYMVYDGTDTTPGSVTINVINDAPTAVADVITVQKNIAAQYNVVANDFDVNGDDVKLVPATNVPTTQGGSYSVNADLKTITYTPKQGFLGNDSATYTLTDVQANVADQLTAVGNLVFVVVNTPPTPQDDKYTISKGHSLNLNVLANDTDPNGDAVSIQNIGEPNSKTAVSLVEEAGVQKISYTTLNRVYEESWRYTVTDVDGGTAQALITVSVYNEPPVALDDASTTNWNVSKVIDVLANDYDNNPGDKDMFITTLKTASTDKGGVVEVVAGRAVKYTPPSGWTGVDSFQYKVSDQIADSNFATVTVTVVDDAPVANPTTVSLHWGTSVAINVLGITGNNDPNGDPIVVSAVSSATHGSVVLNNGIATYTPQNDATTKYVGPDSFTYTLSDWKLTATATVTISVTNAAPVAKPVAITTHWNSSTVTGYVRSVCTDADSDPLTIKSLTLPVDFKGQLVMDSDKYNVLYTPNKWRGDQTANYKITDGPAEDANTIQVTVTNINRPTADDKTFNVHWTTQKVTGTTFAVLSQAGQKDADGDILTFTKEAAATKGGVVTDDGASITYRHSNFLDTESFKYTVTDGLDSATGTVTFTVYDNAPTAKDYAVSYPWSVLQAGKTFDAKTLCEAADPDSAMGDVPSVTGVTRVNAIGSITLDGNVVTFTPTKPNKGTQNLNVQFTDGLLTKNATMSITVTNTIPNAVPVAKSVHWRTQSTGNTWNLVALNEVRDADGDAVTVTSVDNPVNGAVVLSGTSVKFTQTTNFLGACSFQATFTDGWESNTATWNVNVYNNKPVPKDLPFTVLWSTWNAGTQLNVVDSATDADADPITLYAANATSAGGSVSVVAGQVLYKPAKGFTGVETFKYYVFDGLEYGNAIVTVTVIDTAPVAVADTASMHWRSFGVTFNALTNDWDAENDTIAVAAISTQPTIGSFAIQDANNGTIKLTMPSALPLTWSTGNVVGAYTAKDGALTGVPAQITVTITNANKPTAPAVPVNVHWRTVQAGASISLPSYTTATDADGDTLTLSLVSPPSFATLPGTVGKVTYTRASWTGSDSFGYKLTDGMDSSAQGTITVTSYNNIPTAEDIPQQFLSKASFSSGASFNLLSLGKAADIDGADVPFLKLVAVTNLQTYTTATVQIKAGTTDTVFIKPKVNEFSGSDFFYYTVTDGIANVTKKCYVYTTYAAQGDGSSYFSLHWLNKNAGTDLDVLVDAFDATLANGYRMVNFNTTPAAGNTATFTSNTAHNKLHYKNSATFLGDDAFIINVTDELVNFRLNQVINIFDNPPVPQDKTQTTHWRTPLDTDVVAGSTDPDSALGDTVSLKTFTSGAHGTTALTTTLAAGSIRYTSNGIIGTDQYTYTVTDGLLTATANVYVTVTNTPPVPHAQSYDVHWRVFKAGKTLSVMSTDSDANNDPLSLVGISGALPTGVTSSVSTGAKTVTLTGPQTGQPYFGQSFQFTYTITDSSSTGQASETITVNVYNTLPVTVPKTNTIHWRDVNVLKDVVTGDSDADSDTLTLVGAVSSQGAAVSTVGNQVKYTPANKFTGVDTVTYTINDGAQSTTGTYTVTVNNAKPVAKAYTVTSHWKDIVGGYIFNVGGESTDSDNNDKLLLTFAGTLPTINGGTLSQVNSTHIKYVPSAGFVGSTSFQYTVTDGLATSDPATISITVTDGAPTSTTSNTNIHWRQVTTTIPLTFSDPNNDAVSIVGVTSDSGLATVSYSGNTVTYTQKNIGTPLGPDTFTVSFSDGWYQPASTTKYTVTTIDAAPVAKDISVSLHSSLYQTGAIVNVVQNANTNLRPTDSDSTDVPFLKVTDVSGTFQGTATISADGSTITYKPPANTVTNSVITYVVSDGIRTGSAKLTVNVFNTAPTNTDYPKSMKWTECLQGVTINVAQNAADADSADQGKLVFSTPTSSRATISQTAGVISYKCNAASVFTETLAFTTTDTGGLFTTNNIVITITNDAPVAQPDTYRTHWRTPTLNLNVLQNDTDANNDPLSITGLASSTSNGASLSVVSNQVRYSMPSVTASKLDVADKFNYQASDSVSTSASTAVSVTIYDNAPVAKPQATTIKWSGSASFALKAQCTDADSEDASALAFAGITTPVAGTVTVTNQATGAITYTPSAAASATTTYNTPYTMTYSCTDGLLTGSNTVTVNVYNTAPTLSGKSVSVVRNYANPTSGTLSGLLTLGDDDDNDSLKVSNAQTDTDTTLTYSQTSDTFSIKVPATFVGTKQVTWRVTDGQLYSPAATYNIEFTNNAPVCPAVTGITTNKNTPVTVNVACTDANGDPITYAATDVSFGTISGSKAITYTPAQRRSGTAVINFSGTDIVGATTASTATVVVNNRAPTAPAKTYNLEGSHANNEVYTLDYITDASPSDPDNGDTVRLVSATSGTSTAECNNANIGTTSVSGGKILFTRKLSTWVGTCKFNVVVTDDDIDNPLTATAVVTIVIDPSSPFPPTANDDEYSVDQAATTLQIPVKGTAISNGVTYTGIMENDQAPLGTSIVFDTLLCTVSGYCRRTPVLNNNLISYPVDNRNCVQDKFQYRIKTTDSLALTDVATVTIKFTNCYCSAALDIFFVIDSSGSVTQTNFNTQKAFLVNLTNQLDIATDKVKVGIAQFGNDGTVYRSLSGSKSTVVSTLNNLPYLSQHTNTLAGIYAALTDITGTCQNNGTYRYAPNGRKNVPQVIVILTDGASNAPCSCENGNDRFDGPQMTCKGLYGSTNYDAKCQSQNRYPGKSCSYCGTTSGSASCMPCADPMRLTDQINSWNTTATGTSPPSAYSNFPNWKVVAMGIGNLLDNSFGKSQISGMHYDHDPSKVIMVSWANLQTAVSAVIDAACNTNTVN